MRFFYDKEKSLEIMERITKKFEKRSASSRRGSEFHVSDLIWCPVGAYCRVTGVERQRSKTVIGLMVFGIIAEDVIVSCYDKREATFQENARIYLKKDESVFGHIDIFEHDVHPLEVKATRKRVFKASDVPIQWVEQLMSYMSMKGAIRGWLLIFNIFSCQTMAFQMILTQKYILGWIITLATRASNLKKAFSSKDPSHLEIAFKTHNTCDYKHDCPRREECKQKYKEWMKQKRGAK